MILPSKHLSLNRSLLAIAGRILARLRDAQTVSVLWNDLKKSPSPTVAVGQPTISFDWFVLALDFLFLAGAIEFHAGMVRRTGQ